MDYAITSSSAREHTAPQGPRTLGGRASRIEGDYELPIGKRLFRCWSEPIHATLESSSLTIALLPHLAFQRMPENFDRVVVRHFLTPKDFADTVRALRDLGLIPLLRSRRS